MLLKITYFALALPAFCLFTIRAFCLLWPPSQLWISLVMLFAFLLRLALSVDAHLEARQNLHH